MSSSWCPMREVGCHCRLCIAELRARDEYKRLHPTGLERQIVTFEELRLREFQKLTGRYWLKFGY